MHDTTRNEQLIRLRERYARRSKAGKSQVLDELCAEFGYSRKHAIKLLNATLARPSGRPKPGPPPRYQPVSEVVGTIWRAAEQLCGKRLVAALPLWLPHYTRHYGKLLPTQKKLLGEISAATLDRLLATHKVHHGQSGTKPGSLLRTQIALSTDAWDQEQPGYLEVDSVAHCGGSLAGDFLWSLTFTDIPSAWTEGRATFNKGAAGVLEQTRDVEAALPFPLLGVDSDNGSEFLNHHFLRYLQQRPAPVRYTRSRPYHKDDNAHVEQKNWMWPRQLLGYGRLGDPAQVGPVNALYKEVWGPLQNFFLPSMKLVNKERVGSRWVREHDRPQTAYQRLLAWGGLATKEARRLHDRYASLDPFALAQETDRRLRPILKGVQA